MNILNKNLAAAAVTAAVLTGSAGAFENAEPESGRLQPGQIVTLSEDESQTVIMSNVFNQCVKGALAEQQDEIAVARELFEEEFVDKNMVDTVIAYFISQRATLPAELYPPVMNEYFAQHGEVDSIEKLQNAVAELKQNEALVNEFKLFYVSMEMQTAYLKPAIDYCADAMDVDYQDLQAKARALHEKYGPIRIIGPANEDNTPAPAMGQ